MQKLVTYGLMTVVCGALMACGDSDNGRRMSIGNAGTGGGGGSGGGGGGGGSGGSTGGTGGTNGGPAACSGCAEITVPVAATGSRQAQFLFRPAMPIDMSNVVITWSVKVADLSGTIPPADMYVNVFAQNPAPDYVGEFGPRIPLTPENGFNSTDTWVNVEMDLASLITGTAPPPPPPPADAGTAADAGDAGGGTPPPPPPDNYTDVDKTAIFQYGIQVGAAGTAAGTVHIAVDSVDFEGMEQPADVTFTAGLEGFQLDMYEVPAGTTIVHRP